MSKAQKEIVKLRQNIYQANPIVESCKSFNTLGMRVFYLGLCGVNPHLSENDKFYDKDFSLTFISNDQLAKIFGSKWRLSDLKKTCEYMFKNDTIELNHDNGSWVLMHLFKRLEYISDKGLYIQFDDLMRPFLLDLVKRAYTKMGLDAVFRLSSPYAMRLLELMLQYQNIPGMEQIIKRSLTVEEIRFSLNVPKDAYQGRQNNFKKFVINDPIAEINRKTKYQMGYTAFKVGRKITRFEFTLDVSQVERRAANNLKPLLAKTLAARRKEYSEPTAEDMRFLHEIDEKERERQSEVEDRAVNINISPDLLRKVATKKLVEEEIYSIENRVNEKPSDVETLSAMENNDTALGKAQETFAVMKKVAESSGLKLEDFRMGEIPISAEYTNILKKMYREKRMLAEQILKEVHHMTLERFEKLYKP